MLAGVLVVIACQLVTRFMHMDGLADVADALGSYAAPEKAREILADPHAGLIGMGSALLALYTTPRACKYSSAGKVSKIYPMAMSMANTPPGCS